MKIILAIILCIGIRTLAQGQSVETSKAKFSSIIAAGVGSGENGESIVVQTINGVAKGRWFGGLGVGVDYYSNRSIPVFADVRYELLKGVNALIIYGDYGLNKSWLTKDQKGFQDGSTVYKSGVTYETGLAWKLKGKKERAFLFGCGYNFKQMKEELTTINWVLPGRTEQKEYIDRRFRRLIIKVAVQF